VNVTVVGLGHFAGVVASCLAQRGHAICQVDFMPPLMRDGQKHAKDEPGWIPWVSQEEDPDLVWIAYDVPLDAMGAPVVDEVLNRCAMRNDLYPHEIPFLISCQWPVGTLARLQTSMPDRELIYVMENVRVGKAIDDFMNQTMVVVGTRDNDHNSPTNTMIGELLFPFSSCLMPMSPESAEMTKHTTNAFMALQIAFINEIAALSQTVGANPFHVSGGLLSDARVNACAPLNPGGPFGGGSLKRDLKVLERLTQESGKAFPIIEAILPSNERPR
jgi:UDPglucose 6-dehydrogenase